MKDKIQNFHDDLNVVMSEVHDVLEHWGLKGWREYLVVRQPDKSESYVVLAHPADKSDFADKLLDLHKREALARTAAAPRRDDAPRCVRCDKPMVSLGQNAEGHTAWECDHGTNGRLITITHAAPVKQAPVEETR